MGSSSPNTVSNWNPQQGNLAHVLTPILQQQIGQGVSPYTGQLVAPLQGQSQMQAMIDSYNPTQFQQGQTGAINQALSGQPSYQASTDPATTAAYFQQAVADPMMRNYQANIAPQINQGFAAQGGTFSTARGMAQQRQLSDLQSQDAQQLAGMQYQTHMQNQALNAQLAESAANRQMQGIGLAQQYANQPLYSAQALSQALQPMQQQAQAQDAAAYDQWQKQQAYNNPWLQQIMAFLGQQTQSAYQSPNYAGQYIGAGVGALGAGVSAYGNYVAQAAQAAQGSQVAAGAGEAIGAFG